MKQPNGHPVRGYTKLNRSDLKAWDARAWEIIRDAQDFGWTFRVSTRGHAIGRSPDGKATISVATSYDRKRSGSNSRAEFERWKKEHDTKAASEKNVRKLATSLIANMARNLIADYAEKSPDDVPDALKTVLKLMADDDDVAVYMADRISEKRRAPLILTNDLDATDDEAAHEITDASKPWRIQWIMADPDDHRVIGFGGPRMDRERAEGVVAMRLAEEAKAKALAKQAAIDAATPPARELPVAPPMRKKAPAVKMFSCPEPGCDAVFEKAHSLGAHKINKHPNMVACQWCGKKFRNSSLHIHQSNCEQNPTSSDTFECGRCEGVYKVSGRGRHEASCRALTSSQLASKRASNRLRRGLELPANAPIGVVKTAKARGLIVGSEQVAQAQAAGHAVGTLVAQPSTQPAGDLAALAASLPQIADPLSALMNLLAEVEELRAAQPEALKAQIEALTTERDEAIKRAEEAEGKLATLKSVFG